MNNIYRPLDVNNYQAIGHEVYIYAKNHSDVIQRQLFLEHDIPHMLSHCSLLARFLNKNQLTPTVVAITVMNLYSGFPLHRDSQGKAPWIRILWPIINCEGSKTKFWSVDDSHSYLIPHPTIPFTGYLDNAPCDLIDEFELSQPMVVDVQTVHSVHPDPITTEAHKKSLLDQVRISFTIGFDRDLPISRSLDAWIGFQDQS